MAMTEESWDNPFKVGGRYANRKGSFTVLGFSGKQMRIRWDSGEEATCSIESQVRILRNIRRENGPAPVSTSRTVPRSKPNPTPPPRKPDTTDAKFRIANPDLTSPSGQLCSRCCHDLNQKPVISIGERLFCYRCAKTAYPELIDEARRAREREARRTAPARNEYEQAKLAAQSANAQYAARREAAGEAGSLTDRNKWIIVWAIAIPCGVFFPILGLLAFFPVLWVLQPICDRERNRLIAAFDQTNSPPPPFTSIKPTRTDFPDPAVTLHPDCLDPSYVGIGYNRNSILRRDESTCQSCGQCFAPTEIEVHHVLPRAQKGSDSIRNLITLCKKCHFHEDWFDHVHKFNEHRIAQKELEDFNRLNGKTERNRR